MGGKGIPEEMDITSNSTMVATTNSDMVMDTTMRFPDTMRTEMDMDTTMDTTMRFPDTMRTEMDTTMRIPDTIRTEMDTTMRFPDTMRTEMQMDVKPVVLDLCINLGVNKLPPTCVKRPYRHRLAIEIMGNEVAAVSLQGQKDIIIDDLDKRPAVAWGTDHGVRNPHPPATDSHPSPPVVVPASPSAGSRGGLRINLGD